MNKRDDRVNLWLTRNAGALAKEAASIMERKFSASTGARVTITMGAATEAILARWVEENKEK